MEVNKERQIDWDYEAHHASKLSTMELHEECLECFKAGEIAFNMVIRGFKPSFSQGYYHDIISVLRTELARRVNIYAEGASREHQV